MFHAIRPQNSGAGDGTRTRTRETPRRILSPLRLPFRHSGKKRILIVYHILYNSGNAEQSDTVSQFVVALFPIGHESIVGHRGTGLVEIGLYSVVHRYIGI